MTVIVQDLVKVSKLLPYINELYPQNWFNRVQLDINALLWTVLALIQSVVFDMVRLAVHCLTSDSASIPPALICLGWGPERRVRVTQSDKRQWRLYRFITIRSDGGHFVHLLFSCQWVWLSSAYSKSLARISQMLAWPNSKVSCSLCWVKQNVILAT